MKLPDDANSERLRDAHPESAPKVYREHPFQVAILGAQTSRIESYRIDHVHSNFKVPAEPSLDLNNKRNTSQMILAKGSE